MSRKKLEYSIQVGEMLFGAAQEIFEVCGAADDFCVQNIGTSVVFGGTNRVIWHPMRGFRCDRSYCTSQFQSKFARHYPAG